MSFLACIGSLFLGSSFIAAGAAHATNPAPVAAILAKTYIVKKAVALGAPLDSTANMEAAVTAVGGSLALGGLLFALNIKRRAAAAYLASAVLAYTAFVHVNLKDVAATSAEGRVHAVKNIAIVGGLLIAGFGRAALCHSASATKKPTKDAKTAAA